MRRGAVADGASAVVTSLWGRRRRPRDSLRSTREAQLPLRRFRLLLILSGKRAQLSGLFNGPSKGGTSRLWMLRGGGSRHPVLDEAGREAPGTSLAAPARRCLLPAPTDWSCTGAGYSQAAACEKFATLHKCQASDGPLVLRMRV